MAWTQNHLTVLEEAMATGATKVKYADKEVDYRSLAEMKQTRQIIMDELGLNGPTPEKNGRRYGSFSKGLK